MARASDTTPIERMNRTRQAIRTPRAAAIAGIVFALLFTLVMVLVRAAIPEDPVFTTEPDWLAQNLDKIQLALLLVPFSGIAFLWFMGVVRSRLGDQEDQFFSTVFFGSGLLFLAMIFSSAAVAAGMFASYDQAKTVAVELEIFQFGRSLVFNIMNVYSTRMAGVFMISLGTLWMRTRVMPRALIVFTYLLALVMLVTISFSMWLLLVFPFWVFVISVYIIVVSRRVERIGAGEIVGSEQD